MQREETHKNKKRKEAGGLIYKSVSTYTITNKKTKSAEAG